jgi:hypothetical protein
LCIDGDMALDTRDFLACVIPLLTCRIGVLHTLRVHDAKARRGRPPIAFSLLLHLIFLKPAQAGWVRRRHRRKSIDQSSSVPCSPQGNHWEGHTDQVLRKWMQQTPNPLNF